MSVRRSYSSTTIPVSAARTLCANPPKSPRLSGLTTSKHNRDAPAPPRPDAASSNMNLESALTLAYTSSCPSRGTAIVHTRARRWRRQIGSWAKVAHAGQQQRIRRKNAAKGRGGRKLGSTKAQSRRPDARGRQGSGRRDREVCAAAKSAQVPSSTTGPRPDGPLAWSMAFSMFTLRRSLSQRAVEHFSVRPPMV